MIGSQGRFWMVVAGLLAVGSAAGVAAWWISDQHRADGKMRQHDALASVSAMDEDQLRDLCSHCHQRPQPDILPRRLWAKTVWEMSHFGGYGSNVQGKVSTAFVANWYEERAPEKLVLAKVETSQGPGALEMIKREIPSSAAAEAPFVSHIRLANVVGDPRPEIIVCDMRNGVILMGRTDGGPQKGAGVFFGQGSSDSAKGVAEKDSRPPLPLPLPVPGWTLDPIGQVANPGHVEPVDLDADGLMDLVVANLGSFLALDHNLGSVEWLRQTEEGVFERITLAEGLGRVSDVQPADIDGDGDIDLAVAEFGWRSTGRLLLLENRSQEDKSPVFVSLPMDNHHGASHLAVTDLDGDGVRDVVALYSQEHELVRCYLNRGKLKTEFQELYRAPHPAWGYSGFQLVDLDRDGDLDILLTNGYASDDRLLKPCHGIKWLENRGSLRFHPHDLVRMYGVYRAEAADMDNDGDLDIVACALVDPSDVDRDQGEIEFESILWLEQVAAGRFVHRSFEASPAHHPTLTLGDYDLDGDIDVLVGNGQFDDTAVRSAITGKNCIDLWENKLE